MCGIVGYIGSRQSTDVLLDGLSKLEYRGYDSAGVALCVNDEIRVVKAQGRLAVLAEKLNGMPPMASHCGIGHTRWATHGAPSDVNSHPHCAARVSLVHNGIIENYAQLKEHLMKRGYEFCSETDTEVLVKLLDHNYHGEPLDAILRTLEQVRGSYGLAILFKDFPGQIFSVRKESPLIVGYGAGENFLASDIPALLRYTRDYAVLEEGEIAVLSADKIDEFVEHVDLIQVGARNMQNFDLLKQLGQVDRPILLKRGLNATYEEWLMSAEYIMASGNPNVILCERGIRTFETYTRNTLDLQSIPVVRKLSHLPVVVDPSHAGGKWWLVDPMAKASVAAGADGLIIEVHNSPETALCDGAQSLKPEKYDTLLKEITGIAKAVGKEM